MVTHHSGLSDHGSLVLVYRTIHGAVRVRIKELKRRTTGCQLYWLVEDTRCALVYSAGDHLFCTFPSPERFKRSLPGHDYPFVSGWNERIDHCGFACCLAR